MKSLAKTETIIVKLKGLPADVLKRLVETGLYMNKSEAIRAGVIRLGHDYGLINLTEYYEKQLDEAIKDSGLRPSYEEVMETIKEVRKGRRQK